jgi:hypothetical protein
MNMNMHIWRVHGKGRNYGGKELLLTYYFFGCFLGAKATRRKTEFGPWLGLGSLVGTERSSQLSLGRS